MKCAFPSESKEDCMKHGAEIRLPARRNGSGIQCSWFDPPGGRHGVRRPLGQFIFFYFQTVYASHPSSRAFKGLGCMENISLGERTHV